ncbi:MAG: hypothetical protein JSW66_12805 [Phycisphaerales bacterium]|nr:MAG: hypothetical protein JSW66_12805 [Phycisphaerales bacterium]
MNEEGNGRTERKIRLNRKAVLVAIAVAVGIAVVCFTVVALLPRPQGRFFDAPLRSFLTGLGLLAVATPPLIAGLLLKRRAETSPYFEEGFIRAVFNIFGFVCLVLGLICVGLSVWALLKRLLGPG